MKNMIGKLTVVLLLALVPLSSQAIIEARIGYGTSTFDDDNYGALEMQTMRGITLDVIVKPPLLSDFGVGLRYDMSTFDVKPGFEADFDRLSVLANYRFIDTLLYLGVIGTVGLKNDLKLKGGGNTYTFDDNLNYSLGVEGGVHLGLISLGAELGKFFGKFDAPVGMSPSEMDLGSFYAKAFIGFGF